jgi:hypothetical protein
MGAIMLVRIKRYMQSSSPETTESTLEIWGYLCIACATCMIGATAYEFSHWSIFHTTPMHSSIVALTATTLARTLVQGVRLLSRVEYAKLARKHKI